jgi:hypothetical protein
MSVKSKKVKLNDEEFKQLDRMSTVFRSGGYDPTTGDFLELKDALDVQNAAFMIPRAMTQIVQEGIEPC